MIVPSRPVAGYRDAINRIESWPTRELIAPLCETRLLVHGDRTANVAVLLHGLTNCPNQFGELAEQLHTRGWNVVVPRLPGHGLPDRMTTALSDMRAEEMLAIAAEAVDCAGGLGDRVAVAGISLGGALAAWLGQTRPIALVVPIAPTIALLNLPFALSQAVLALGRRLPNRFIWWDPRLKTNTRPPTAYPRVPTHALAETFRIGAMVREMASRQAPAARSLVTVLNSGDPAVANRVTRGVVADWRRHGADATLKRFRRGVLPAVHDIIDPGQSYQRVDRVYPVLLRILAG